MVAGFFLLFVAGCFVALPREADEERFFVAELFEAGLSVSVPTAAPTMSETTPTASLTMSLTPLAISETVSRADSGIMRVA